MDQMKSAEIALIGAGDSGGGGGRGVVGVISRGSTFRVGRRAAETILRNARGLVS